MVFLDWRKGAAGPSYSTSAANTQLVGRQLAAFVAALNGTGTDRAPSGRPCADFCVLRSTSLSRLFQVFPASRST